MASSFDKTTNALNIINAFQKIEQIAERINNKSTADLSENRLPIELGVSAEGTQQRIDYLEKEHQKKLAFLTGQTRFTEPESIGPNIENYIGMSMVPTGVIGPLRVIGSVAQGDFFVPLATTEGALVASYHRGAKACYMAGGATSVCLVEGVQRSPVFKFANLGDLGIFIAWVLQQVAVFKEITSKSSRYAKLNDVKLNIEGNHLILTFEYHTGDAAGQNMVTFCTEAICAYIIANTPMPPVKWYLESNYSGDKKATSLSFSNVRGKKVTAEIILPKKVVAKVLKSTPEDMVDYWVSSTVGIIQSGAIGAHGHYANGLTALFLATGQDVACIAEASIGITRMELTPDGDLYASVTLPNLIVGTVGGGTALPTQKECLELMECFGTGHARKFAEICGALVLAGELSISAALSAGHFASAHKTLGRKAK